MNKKTFDPGQGQVEEASGARRVIVVPKRGQPKAVPESVPARQPEREAAGPVEVHEKVGPEEALESPEVAEGAGLRRTARGIKTLLLILSLLSSLFIYH